jgi:hypothetical protein
MTNECYATSCWCAPFRWLCCSIPKKRPQISVTTAVALPAMQTQVVQPQTATSPRERTWKLSHGRLNYSLSQPYDGYHY